MRVSRKQFVDQFSISVHVHALSLWSRRSKEPPDYVATAMYKAMTVCSGNFPISSAEFSRIVEPIIHELHRTIPRTKRPEARDLTGRTYDALNAASIEVTIRPPVKAHGH